MTTENKLQIASEKAEVMLAFDRGEKVERRYLGDESWIHDSNPSWDWPRFKWRVMVKPVEYWLWVYADGTLGSGCWYIKIDDENRYPLEQDYKNRAVLVHEVIE